MDNSDLSFPGLLSPEKDELLSSFLYRLAHNHFLKVHTFCKLVFPDIPIWNRDIDRSAPEEIIRILARRNNIEIEKTMECLIKNYEGKVFSHHNSFGFSKWVLQLGLFHRTRRRSGLMFCPGCLRNDLENPYFRKSWRLSLFVVCTKCNSLLYDKCPSCGSPIIFFRSELGSKRKDYLKEITACHFCKFDLRRADNQYVSRRFIRMQNYFESLIENRRNSFLYTHQYFDVIYQLIKVIKGPNDYSKTTRQKLSKILKIKLLEEYNVQKHRYFDVMSVELRLPLLFSAFWLMQDWPNRFIGFCKTNRIWSSPILKDFEEAPYWFFDIVKENLFVSNINRHFSDFEEIFFYKY